MFLFSLVEVEPVNATTIMELEELIQELFPPEKLITPDDVRGRADSVSEAVLGRMGCVVLLAAQILKAAICVSGLL